MQPLPGQTTTGWLRSPTWKADFPLHYEHEEGTIAPQFVIEEIDRVTDSDAVIVHRRRPAPDVGDALLSILRGRAS